MLSRLKIERSTTVDRIVATIRDEILQGKLPPGTRLREVELAQTLGVSRNTVRETISALVSEGLLTRNAYRGVVVTQLSAADVTDIYTARRTIELAAVDVAAAASGDRLRPLGDAVEELVRITRSEQGDLAHLADAEVHRALVRLLGSERLSHAHAALLAELRLVLSGRYATDDREAVIRSHLEFVELVKRGDGPGARAQLDRRLRDAEAEVLASL